MNKKALPVCLSCIRRNVINPIPQKDLKRGMRHKTGQ